MERYTFWPFFKCSDLFPDESVLIDRDFTGEAMTNYLKQTKSLWLAL